MRCERCVGIVDHAFHIGIVVENEYPVSVAFVIFSISFIS